jgi:hypothetical protein
VKKSRSPEILASAGIALVLSLIPLAGYVFDIPALVTFLINKQPMVLSTALSIAIASISIATYNLFQTPASKFWLQISGVLLIFVALIVISETIFGLSWIDFPALHGQVPSKYPGRMSVNTAICTFLTGSCFIAISKPGNKALIFISSFCVSLIITISTFGLIGYFASFEFLVTFGQTNKMAIPTAVAFIAIGIGTLQIARNTHISNDTVDLQKIYVTLEYLLLLIIFIVALSSFASSQQRIESLKAEELAERGKQARLYFQDIINLHIHMVTVNSKRPEVIETLNFPVSTARMSALFKDLEQYGYLQINVYQSDKALWTSPTFVDVS